MVVTLDAKRRLTVPTALAPAKPGDYFDAHFDAEEERLLEKAGQRVPVEDSYIAATARRHGLTIATGNEGVANRDLDYSTLRTNKAEFERIKAAVVSGNGQKKKITVR